MTSLDWTGNSSQLRRSKVTHTELIVLERTTIWQCNTLQHCHKIPRHVLLHAIHCVPDFTAFYSL